MPLQTVESRIRRTGTILCSRMADVQEAFHATTSIPQLQIISTGPQRLDPPPELIEKNSTRVPLHPGSMPFRVNRDRGSMAGPGRVGQLRGSRTKGSPNSSSAHWGLGPGGSVHLTAATTPLPELHTAQEQARSVPPTGCRPNMLSARGSGGSPPRGSIGPSQASRPR